MRVIALVPGFYGGSPVEVGTEFEVPDGSKSAWYAPAGNEPKASRASKPKKDEQPQALSSIGKEQPKSFNDSLA